MVPLPVASTHSMFIEWQNGQITRGYQLDSVAVGTTGEHQLPAFAPSQKGCETGSGLGMGLVYSATALPSQQLLFGRTALCRACMI